MRKIKKENMKWERMEERQQFTNLHVAEKSFERKGKNWHGE